MSVRIVVWTGFDDRPLCELLNALPDCEALLARSREEALPLLTEADAFVASAALWDEPLSQALNHAPGLRWLQLVNAGFDPIERYGVPGNVVVTTMGPVGSEVVAEHAMTLLLAVMRRVPVFASSNAAAMKWNDRGEGRAMVTLWRKHVAVVGYGPVGAGIVQRLRAFGARATVVSRTARVEDSGMRVSSYGELPSLLPTVDAVIIACPLKRETRHLFDLELFPSMKPGSFLVNVSRGPVVDTLALLAALKVGVVAGAGLDVTDPEPLPDDHPLWRQENVLITPHVSWGGGGTAVRSQLEALVLDNAQRLLSGQPLQHRATIER
jgi:phosphoglycerate dehydrogenase-like enzyme